MDTMRSNRPCKLAVILLKHRHLVLETGGPNPGRGVGKLGVGNGGGGHPTARFLCGEAGEAAPPCANFQQVMTAI